MKPEIDSPVDEHEMSVDRVVFSVDRVVTKAMYDLAERLGQGAIANLISGCRLGAIKAMKSNKPELAAVFIHLGAELMASADDEVVIESAIVHQSKAIDLISSIA